MTASQRKGIVGAVVCESDAETDAARWGSSATRKKAQNASPRAYGGRRTASGGEVDGSAVIARSMSEKALSDHIVNLARMLGWLVHRDPTWRATGTDAGYPDLTLVWPATGRVVWAELKAMDGRLTNAQQTWGAVLRGGQHECYVFRPTDWLDGTIERVLRGEG